MFSGITILFLIALWALGFLVDLAVDYISPEMEAIIFSPVNVTASELNEPGGSQEVELQRLLDGLQKCGRTNYPLKVFIKVRDDVNAMAMPGGRIYVFSGLLNNVKSENGLSFVLAHELGHFKNRDHLRGMGRRIVFTALTAFLSGAESKLTQLFASATDFTQAQYSQKQEEMADQLALKILSCYYGHVGGANEIFEAMKPKEKGQIIGRYFSTHPQSMKRIENLQRLTTSLNLVVKEVLPLPEALKIKETDRVNIARP